MNGHSKCGLTTGGNDILADRMLPTHKLIQIVKAMWNKNVSMVFEALLTRDRFNTRLREVKLAIGYKQYNSISNVASGLFPKEGEGFIDKYSKGKKYHHMMPSQKKLRLYFDRYGMITATGPTGKSLKISGRLATPHDLALLRLSIKIELTRCSKLGS